MRLFALLALALAPAAMAHRNVLGTQLAACTPPGTLPTTGYFRDGFCRTDESDSGRHVVAAVVDARFLAFTRARGNDLETPRPPSFAGLRPGDRWCLCALRWKEALDGGAAPRVDLNATHEAALRYVALADLTAHALGAAGGGAADLR